jgi:hypothetical protein
LFEFLVPVKTKMNLLIQKDHDINDDENETYGGEGDYLCGEADIDGYGYERYDPYEDDHADGDECDDIQFKIAIF